MLSDIRVERATWEVTLRRILSMFSMFIACAFALASTLALNRSKRKRLPPINSHRVRSTILLL